MKNKYIILAFTFLSLLLGHSSYGQIYNGDFDDFDLRDTVKLPELPIINKTKLSISNVDNTPNIYIQLDLYTSRISNFCLLCDDDNNYVQNEPVEAVECWFCDEKNDYASTIPISTSEVNYRVYNIPGHYSYLIDFVGLAGSQSGKADIVIDYDKLRARYFAGIPVSEVRALAYIMSATDEKYHTDIYSFVKANPVIGLKILKAYTASNTANQEDVYVNTIALALLATGNYSAAAAAVIIPRVIQYYNYELNKLRQEHPEWSDFKLKATAALNVLQTGLDIVGLVPAAGEVADLVNGAIYLVRGDLANAAISGLSIVPIGGQLASGSRLAVKIVDGVAVPIAKGVDEVEALLKISDDVLANQGAPKELLEKIIKWTDGVTHEFKWPPNDGFKAGIQNIDIPKNTIIDRYGSSAGKFTSPAGTPYGQRALAPGSSLDLHTYEVLKPLPTQVGEVLPWFDEIGGGIQYKFDKTIEQLIEEGFLKEIF